MRSVLINILPTSKCMTAFGVILISILLDWSPVLADLEKYSFLKSQLYIHGVVPEVIHEAPPHEMQIKYGREKLKMGNFIWPSQALENIPKMIRYPSDRREFYVFIMTAILNDSEEYQTKVQFHTGFPLKPGKVLTPSQATLPPLQVSYPAHEKGYYLSVLIDPDSPNRTKPVDREFLHWLVGNIPGVAVSRGAELMPYFAPLPAKGTGVHRYVFIVFQQPKGVINYEDELGMAKKPNNEGRRKFNTVDFAQKYGLGEAVAVTFFRMEWDEHYENSTLNL